MILDSQKQKITFKSVLLDLKLAINVIGLLRVSKIVKREGIIKRLHPSSPFSYLWYIGVLTSLQGRGIGSKLLWEVQSKSDAEKTPIYLETSTVTNIPFYKKHGYTIYDEIDLGHKLYFMKKLF